MTSSLVGGLEQHPEVRQAGPCGHQAPEVRPVPRRCVQHEREFAHPFGVARRQRPAQVPVLVDQSVHTLSLASGRTEGILVFSPIVWVAVPPSSAVGPARNRPDGSCVASLPGAAWMWWARKACPGSTGGIAMSTATNSEAAVGRLTSARVWHALEKASFAVLSYDTPSGEPRSSGVVYKVARPAALRRGQTQRLEGEAHRGERPGRGDRSRAARRHHVARVPIPPATVSFHATAIVHPPGSSKVARSSKELGALLPAERQDLASIIEIVPEGAFVTYAIDVPLRKMRDPAAARARVSVSR